MLFLMSFRSHAGRVMFCMRPRHSPQTCVFVFVFVFMFFHLLICNVTYHRGSACVCVCNVVPGVRVCDEQQIPASTLRAPSVLLSYQPCHPELHPPLVPALVGARESALPPGVPNPLKSFSLINSASLNCESKSSSSTPRGGWRSLWHGSMACSLLWTLAGSCRS